MWNGACHLWSNGGFGAWGWVGIILYMLFWVGLITGLIYLMIRFARRSELSMPAVASPFTPVSAAPGSQTSYSALEIAQLRYARGEIDRETYLKLVDDLR